MKITIYEGYVGVLTKGGVFKAILKPGRHSYAKYWGHEGVTLIDMRLMNQTVNLSATTADNVLVSVLTRFGYRVTSPRAYLGASQNPMDFFVSEASNILSNVINSAKHDGIEPALADQADTTLKQLNEMMKPLGLEAVTMAKPTVTLPKNIRNAFDALVAARSKALADLEEARGRTAVLRHYANTADIIKDKPEIMQLLLGQKAKNIHIDFSKSDK